MPELDVEEAYGIDGPEDAKRLYANWAAHYDAEFGAGWGYVAPREIARLYLSEGGDAPCLDVGAGTGLVAEHLPGLPVDGFDISADMLDQARPKGVYRKLIEGDLLQPLEMADNSYGGVISAGTFTHGHVGPECLRELLRVVRPGGLFVCGCIPAVFDGMGFGSRLAGLQAAGAISPLRFAEIAIYEGADHPHAGDRGLVMIFRVR